jgi:hypothetical protein
MIITGLIKIIELLSGKGDADNTGRRCAGGLNADAQNKNQNAPVHPSDTKQYRKSGGNGRGITGA